MVCWITVGCPSSVPSIFRVTLNIQHCSVLCTSNVLCNYVFRVRLWLGVPVHYMTNTFLKCKYNSLCMASVLNCCKHFFRFIKRYGTKSRTKQTKKRLQNTKNSSRATRSSRATCSSRATRRSSRATHSSTAIRSSRATRTSRATHSATATRSATSTTRSSTATSLPRETSPPRATSPSIATSPPGATDQPRSRRSTVNKTFCKNCKCCI